MGPHRKFSEASCHECNGLGGNCGGWKRGNWPNWTWGSEISGIKFLLSQRLFWYLSFFFISPWMHYFPHRKYRSDLTFWGIHQDLQISLKFKYIMVSTAVWLSSQITFPPNQPEFDGYFSHHSLIVAQVLWSYFWKKNELLQRGGKHRTAVQHWSVAATWPTGSTHWLNAVPKPAF